MEQSQVLPVEEYIEQAYFFRVLRERLADGLAAQEILTHLDAEILSTTRLPYAIQFMAAELKHSGLLGASFARLGHYFTSLQTHIIEAAEQDNVRFTLPQALLILEKEADYRAHHPTTAGLFLYQLETLSRNRLGYSLGLKAMEQDPFYNEEWRAYLRLVRNQLGEREFAELLFARSEHYVKQRQRNDSDYQPPFVVLFGEKEGMIAAANRGKDPMYLFATLQRQLGYPRVPRPPRVDTTVSVFDDIFRRLKLLEDRVVVLQGELHDDLDVTQFYVKKEEAES